MKKYHKIQTVFKRDPQTKHKNLIENDFSEPEFEYLQNNNWIFTEKVDGTNIRIQFDGEKITFGGKTDNAQIPTQLANKLNNTFLPMLPDFKAIFSESEVCLYGEGYGLKIQKAGKLYKQEQDFVLFDIKIGDWWLQRKDVEEIALKLKIDVVPIIGNGTIAEMVDKVKNGFNSKWGDFLAEGIVARPATELKTRSGHRIITKLKYKDYRK